MPTRAQLYAILGVAVLAWGGSLWIANVPLTRDHLAPFSASVAAMYAACAAFDRWLWRWPLVRTVLAKRPIIHGTWKAVLQSTYKDKATGKVVDPIEAVMVINQTYSAYGMRLFTTSARSHSLTSGFSESPDGRCEAVAVYQNDPEIGLRDQESAIHFGTVKMEVERGDSLAMRGEYWTTRSTKGTIHLTDRVDELAPNLEEGNKLLTRRRQAQKRRWWRFGF